VSRSTDALHGNGDSAGAGNLADEINVADIDAELERGGRNQNLDFAAFQALFSVESQGPRQGAMVGGYVFYPESLGKGEGNLLH
jgi:hypothetical protein